MDKGPSMELNFRMMSLMNVSKDFKKKLVGMPMKKHTGIMRMKFFGLLDVKE